MERPSTNGRIEDMPKQNAWAHLIYYAKALRLVGGPHHCRAPEGADDVPIELGKQGFDPFDDEI